MATEANQESSNEGEKQTPGNDTEFYKAMIRHEAKESLIEKLTACGFDKMSTISAIKTSEDINDVAKECKLNLQEKYNLKAVINKLLVKQSVVDPEELNAVDSMREKLDAIQASIDLTGESTKKIENEFEAHSQNIKEIFERIRSCLKERENKLMNKLQQSVTEKKQMLSQIESQLQTQSVGVKTKIEASQKIIKEPIDMTNAAMKERKEKILKMAGEVSDIKTLNKEDSVIANCTINVHLDENEILGFVSNFGDVSSTLWPILTSLKNNGDNTVVIGWKVCGTKSAKNETYNISFEWQQAQTSDDEKEQSQQEAAEKNELDQLLQTTVIDGNFLDYYSDEAFSKFRRRWQQRRKDKKLNDDKKEQWQQREVQKNKIDEMNEQAVNVNFDSDIGLFAFRLRIFDQLKNKWSLPSNAMSVQMKNNYKLPQGLDGSVLIKGNYLEKMLMKNVLLQPLKNKRFELLLRGSEHGLSIQAFNDRCKDKGSVFVIVQSNEYLRTFGGYTKVGFISGKVGYLRDDDAFLFYIDPKTNKAQRYRDRGQHGAVYSHTKYGVCFGNYDLYWDGKGKGHCNRSRNYDYSVTTEKIPLSGGANGWTVSDFEIWNVI